VKIVVTGAAGMVGSALVRGLAPEHDVVAVVHRTPLPADLRGVPAAPWDLHGPLPPALEAPADAWIHCAAFTSVDGAEARPDEAWRVNVDGTRAAARAAAAAGARMVYVSTDAVFDGTRGLYAEEDAPAPVNAYARGKLAGEAEAAAAPGALVVRMNVVSRGAGLVRWLLEAAGSGAAVPLFRDVFFNPVPVDAFAGLVLGLLGRGAQGVVHLGSAEVLSKAQFGRLVLAHAGLGAAPVVEQDLRDAGLRAPRALDTSLCTLHARRMGLRMPSLNTLFSTLHDAQRPQG
jgi:dTDP-4-dehydrorhamnose reductase